MREGEREGGRERQCVGGRFYQRKRRKVWLVRLFFLNAVKMQTFFLFFYESRILVLISFFGSEWKHQLESRAFNQKLFSLEQMFQITLEDYSKIFLVLYWTYKKKFVIENNSCIQYFLRDRQNTDKLSSECYPLIWCG